MNTHISSSIRLYMLTFAVFVAVYSPLTLAWQAQLQQLAEQQKAVAEAHGDFLAAGFFESADKNLSLARKAVEKGYSDKRIQRYVDAASRDLTAAAAATQQAKVTFASVIAVRDAAVKAQASQRAPDLWAMGEKNFVSGLQRLEKGRQKPAQRLGMKAESSYREAELVAIKDELLGDARRLRDLTVERRVERQAPKTLALAQQWLSQAEQTLNSDRYNRGEAIELASRAGYEFAHALYLNALLLKLQDGSMTTEELALAVEEPLQRIAAAVDLQVAFDNGVEQPTLSIINRVEGLREDSLALNISRDRVMQLEEEVDLVQQQLGRQSDRLSKQLQRQQRFERIEASFNVDEGQVYRAGTDILIRLTGLNFKSGDATIAPENSALLDKVMNAIRLYPDASLVIEGHTDSYGSELTNANLSQKRADAVVDYLKSRLPELQSAYLRAIGYGESRPVASNSTVEGRKANRRIDLLIKPN